MPTLRKAIPFAVSLFLMLVSTYLIFERNGILAWLGVLLGAALLAKLFLKPSKGDLILTFAVTSLWTIAWAGIFYYVISTWETGDVVEVTIATADGDHTARTWILEGPDTLMLYYDAPDDAANALLNGAPLIVTRAGEAIPFNDYTVQRQDEMTEAEINRVFELMATKYGDRVAAADIFYGFLGRARNRVGIVVQTPREGRNNE